MEIQILSTAGIIGAFNKGRCLLLPLPIKLKAERDEVVWEGHEGRGKSFHKKIPGSS